ncbi:transcriptional regulator lysR family protein [Parvularcula bermudensis HTCC2503]|uniref:Transcriptional regulator lysR family protein n=1 Tax=Parvularcula bermudensis (strain ATCC BAA-594 / HTCC2503 / KCTC 12087) TaxID=314260 RepID=E0THE6_PARBH|nr:LysR family transcriptional regulator [Parvularcula bermudensis]ADM10738.1 transcriptional regulator lysR family protein [Parvularcula bermudensis HTCC2503]
MALNYNHLRYFWAVAHEGNLTRTAERLNVSQSSLSIQIKKLEDRLGMSLFQRRGKQLILTEAGMIALSHADAIFAVGAELVDTLAQRVGQPIKPLRVGALSTLSRNVQIEFLRPLITGDAGGVTVRSGRLDDLMEALVGLSLDVVLSNQAPLRTVDSPWLLHPITDQPVSLVGPPARRRSTDLDTLLSEEPLILPSKDSTVRHGFDALIAERGLSPKILAEVDDMALLRVFAREHTGLTIVPPIVVKDELANGRLTEVAALPRFRETFYALTMPRRFPHPTLVKLLEGAPTIPGGESKSG